MEDCADGLAGGVEVEDGDVDLDAEDNDEGELLPFNSKLLILEPDIASQSKFLARSKTTFPLT